MELYRFKPNVFMSPYELRGMIEATKDDYEQVKLAYCPKYQDQYYGCPSWNNGEGSEECCQCRMGVWEVVNNA
ncbi:MAG: hypothetical protein AWM53_02005 [Candidatus Dichloromethanomonas elyunquensis]|nr:MAG: hypothetical protein AWM53_02005 [Candidatus Dichloromethanomonas elyunquensis]